MLSSIVVSIVFGNSISVHAEGKVIVDSIYATSLEGNLLGDPVKRAMNIYLPPGYDTTTRNYPVIYLMHTGGGNERFYSHNEFPPMLESTGMFTKPQDFPAKGFAWLIDSLIDVGDIGPMIIVMPDINTSYGGSFCINSALNGNYEDYVVDDIVPYIDSKYRTLVNNNCRAIAGHCMGGFGAMYLAMRHPGVFGLVASHSSEFCIDALGRACKPYIKAENPTGLTGPDPAKTFTSFMYMFSAAYSPNLSNPPYYVDFPFDDTCGIREEVFTAWAAYDPIQMLPDYISALASLKGIYMDVGDKDELQSSYFMAPFSSALTSSGIPHSFEVFDGTHFNKMYTRLSKALSFLSDSLEHMATGPTLIPEGNVSGTWAKEDSPYHINGEITIPDGKTLIIEPGVDVIFKGYYKFKIEGRLLAIGTREEEILFTADDQTDGWHGLHFENIKPSNDSSKLVHCELTYGRASGSFPDDYGGAIFVASYSKLIINKCHIHHNTAVGGGGGIVLGYNSCPVISNNIIAYNQTQYGGGLCMVSQCKPVVVNNIFHHNSASVIGGGININQTSNPVLFNNTITQNNAGSGGGLSCRDNSDPTIANTIIFGNSSDNGSQVYLYVANCDPHFYNCDIEAGLNGFGGPGSGAQYSGTYLNNIDADPLFSDAVNNDYHLSDNSPCISVGADSIELSGKWYYAPNSDFSFTTRPFPANSKPDIGALENSLGTPEITGIFDIKKSKETGINTYCYPNPFSEKTLIYYTIPKPGIIRIKFYSTNGTELHTFSFFHQDAGEYEMEWHAVGLSAGIYYYTIQTDSGSVTKCLIIKPEM